MRRCEPAQLLDRCTISTRICSLRGGSPRYLSSRHEVQEDYAPNVAGNTYRKSSAEISRRIEVTGSKGEKARPAFRQMFEAASRREFDVLLFWSLDRLSREGVLPTLTYLQRLTSYGIKWRSFTEQYIDSCGVFADAVISIMAVIAKQENIRRSERTRAGLARVRASGRRLGPPRRLNGQHTAAIASLRGQGLSGRAIARQLCISEGSVRRLSAAA